MFDILSLSLRLFTPPSKHNNFLSPLSSPSVFRDVVSPPKNTRTNNPTTIFMKGDFEYTYLSKVCDCYWRSVSGSEWVEKRFTPCCPSKLVQKNKKLYMYKNKFLIKKKSLRLSVFPNSKMSTKFTLTSNTTISEYIR